MPVVVAVTAVVAVTVVVAAIAVDVVVAVVAVAVAIVDAVLVVVHVVIVLFCRDHAWRILMSLRAISRILTKGYLGRQEHRVSCRMIFSFYSFSL